MTLYLSVHVRAGAHLSGWEHEYAIAMTRVRTAVGARALCRFESSGAWGGLNPPNARGNRIQPPMTRDRIEPPTIRRKPAVSDGQHAGAQLAAQRTGSRPGGTQAPVPRAMRTAWCATSSGARSARTASCTTSSAARGARDWAVLSPEGGTDEASTAH